MKSYCIAFFLLLITCSTALASNCAEKCMENFGGSNTEKKEKNRPTKPLTFEGQIPQHPKKQNNGSSKPAVNPAATARLADKKLLKTITDALRSAKDCPSDFYLAISSIIQNGTNHAVLQNALQYHSCFISSSSKDADFVNRLYADLQNTGIRCWYAPEDMKGGKKLHDQINEAIGIYDKLLLVLSEHSMSSNWVLSEIESARQKEKLEGKKILFPISLTSFEKIAKWQVFDADDGRDLASEIRSYYIPNFSNWKKSGFYRTALQKLIKALETDLQQAT